MVWACFVATLNWRAQGGWGTRFWPESQARSRSSGQSTASFRQAKSWALGTTRSYLEPECVMRLWSSFTIHTSYFVRHGCHPNRTFTNRSSRSDLDGGNVLFKPPWIGLDLLCILSAFFSVSALVHLPPWRDHQDCSNVRIISIWRGAQPWQRALWVTICSRRVGEMGGSGDEA